MAAATDAVARAEPVICPPYDARAAAYATGQGIPRTPGRRSWGWVRGLALFELDADGVVAVLVDVLDGVRALGLHPAHSWTGRPGWAGLGLELQGAAA